MQWKIPQPHNKSEAHLLDSETVGQFLDKKNGRGSVRVYYRDKQKRSIPKTAEIPLTCSMLQVNRKSPAQQCIRMKNQQKKKEKDESAWGECYLYQYLYSGRRQEIRQQV